MAFGPILESKSFVQLLLTILQLVVNFHSIWDTGSSGITWFVVYRLALLLLEPSPACRLFCLSAGCFFLAASLALFALLRIDLAVALNLM